MNGSTINNVIIFFFCYQMKRGLETNFIMSLGHVPKKPISQKIAFFPFATEDLS